MCKIRSKLTKRHQEDVFTDFVLVILLLTFSIYCSSVFSVAFEQLNATDKNTILKIVSYTSLAYCFMFIHHSVSMI